MASETSTQYWECVHLFTYLNQSYELSVNYANNSYWKILQNTYTCHRYNALTIYDKIKFSIQKHVVKTLLRSLFNFHIFYETIRI